MVTTILLNIVQVVHFGKQKIHLLLEFVGDCFLLKSPLMVGHLLYLAWKYHLEICLKKDKVHLLKLQQFYLLHAGSFAGTGI